MKMLLLKKISRLLGMAVICFILGGPVSGAETPNPKGKDILSKPGIVFAGGTELQDEAGFTTGYLEDRFFSGTSFPLHKLNDSPFTPPWVDTVMLERVLGCDRALGRKAPESYLAWRDGEGKIQYRWELLPKRIGPLMAGGYKSVVLVLEDIPPCFVDPELIRLGEFGQIHPPTDYPAYQEFMKAFTVKLIELYGKEAVVNRILFKVGSDMTNPKRFLGD